MSKLHGVVQMLKKEHDRVTRELSGITAALSAFGVAYGSSNENRRRISLGGRARIAAAQRARWARARGSKNNVTTMPKKRSLSPAARKRIAAAQRARWAKARAAKKSV